ncbi:hypothetical protein M0R45_026411 [Rubus argutus]|uniref:Uncharacterized protein n=1 Tax=Rubus argutus TaxID=59490 RepID=A0AAW1X020_RUBAR
MPSPPLSLSATVTFTKTTTPLPSRPPSTREPLLCLTSITHRTFILPTTNKFTTTQSANINSANLQCPVLPYRELSPTSSALPHNPHLNPQSPKQYLYPCTHLITDPSLPSLSHTENQPKSLITVNHCKFGNQKRKRRGDVDPLSPVLPALTHETCPAAVQPSPSPSPQGPVHRASPSDVDPLPSCAFRHHRRPCPLSSPGPRHCRSSPEPAPAVAPKLASPASSPPSASTPSLLAVSAGHLKPVHRASPSGIVLC